MDKKALRANIRQQKRAMTEEEIQLRSEKLAEKFFASPAYQNAETIYGYLPYNQEVRTTPMLVRALEDGKRVAVPKVYGDEMKFIYLTDMSQVAKGYAYAGKGDVEKARAEWEKAAAQGSDDAKHNLAELLKSLEDKMVTKPIN